MYYASETELDSLCHAGNAKTLDLALFSVSCTVLLGVALALATIQDLSDRVHSTLWAIGVGAFLLSIFFGAKAILSWKSSTKTLEDIKRRPAE